MASLQSIGALYNSLTAGSKIIGTVVTDSDFRIDGIVEGDVQCKGKIVIGEKGAVQGDLSCQNADVLGCIEGAIKVDGTLSLRATGSINGDVQTKVLIVEPKAQFNGSCSMKQVAPEPKKDASEHTDKEPKKEEPKVAPKKEEPKKEQPKKEEKPKVGASEHTDIKPKKEEPKVKELDLKVEEVKVADIKVEEPVLAVNESSIGNGQEENIITFIDDEPEIVAVEA